MRTLARTLFGAGVALALITATLVATAPAHAEEAAPQLSITLTNSEKTVKPGDQVTLKGQLKNLGAAEQAVSVVLSAPSYVGFEAANGAEVDKNTATWKPTIAPGADSTFTIRATIGKIPSTERRVTTLASVYVGDNPAPIVRTANASFIEGVKDTPGGKATTTAARKAVPDALPWIVGGVVLLVAVLAAAVLLALRTRRNRVRRRTPHS